MPLQKPHPPGSTPPATDPHSTKRRQLQGRRRSLHTISELCATDGATSDYNSFNAAKQKQQRNQTNTSMAKSNTYGLDKRRSLPQYCSSPQCLQAQALGSQPPSLHPSASYRSPASQTTDMRLQETNWNARRERSRIHHEQSTRGATTYRRQNLSHKPQDGSYPALPRKTSKPSSSSNIRTYSSHHQLLANSRSMSGFSSSSSSNGTLDRRSSLGAMSGHGHTDARAGDAESSGRASTDSSSFHSTQDGAVQRSRSGSSVHSTFASQIVPPLPVASPPPMQRYRTDTFSYPDINRAIGPGRPTRPSSTTRTTSLPTIRIERVAATGHENRHSMSRSPQHKHQHHQTDIQKARLESLAALTAAHPTTSSSQRRHQTYRPLSHSHLKPPPQYSALSPSHNTKTPHTSTDLQPSIHEKRPLPNRESLTQWKAERDQDVAGTTRKAHIKERVRRANELELEREQELVKVGKGTGKERERGCFAGILGVFGLRAR